MMFDTNIVSELRGPRSPRLSAWAATLATDICISAVTITELQFGASSVATRRPFFAAELNAWLDRLIATAHVVPLTAEAARLLGRMQAVSALRHLALAPPDAPRFGSDLGIAAIAVTAGVPVATLNLRDFRLIARHFPALHVVDPLGSR